MNEVKSAIDILKDGGIVIYPTDTAFGIGCRIDNEKAVEKLFRIRNRPVIQAVPVLASSLEMASGYVQKIPKDVEEKLIKKYWPGALTIIFECRIGKVPSLVRGGGTTLGIRIPDHKTTLSIIEGVSVPILGPSANFSGEETPYEFENLNPQLVNLADYVVGGQTQTGKVSTVIDVTKKPWKILRGGAVKISL